MVKLAAVPRVLQRGEAEALLLSEMATRGLLLPHRERDPGLRSTLVALLRLYRAWRESGPGDTEAKGARVAERLLALGEGLSELERAFDEFEVALFFHEFAHYAEALAHSEKGLAIRLKQRGPDHPAAAAACFSMASVFRSQVTLTTRWRMTSAVLPWASGRSDPSTATWPIRASALRRSISTSSAASRRAPELRTPRQSIQNCSGCRSRTVR
jgi:hypothetical protein